MSRKQTKEEELKRIKEEDEKKNQNNRGPGGRAAAQGKIRLEEDTGKLLVRLFSYFEKNPAVILDVMQQLCNRLRRTTKDYVEACHTAYDAVEAEKSGKKSQSLTDRIRKLCRFYSDNSYYPYY